MGPLSPKYLLEPREKYKVFMLRAMGPHRSGCCVCGSGSEEISENSGFFQFGYLPPPMNIPFEKKKIDKQTEIKEHVDEREVEHQPRERVCCKHLLKLEKYSM